MESLLRDLNALKCKIIETVTFWLKLATEGPAEHQQLVEEN